MSIASRPPARRLPYSSIIDRPQLSLPGKARLVVWPVVNVEHWDIGKPMARQVLPAPTAAPVLPDIANWCWHEYGMRVGFWRLKAALDRFGMKATLSINGHVCESYPEVAGAARDAGWEFMGHGYVQTPTHKVDDQVAMITRTVETIRAFTGKGPVGWLGPGLTQTFDTVDHLARAGVRYIGDWCLDDQPMRFETAAGPMTAMPYSVELNDVPMVAVQHHEGPVLLQRIRDSFDRLYEEGRDQPRIMCIAVHPFLSGVPHRIRYFEEALAYISGRDDVLVWTGEQILDWHDGQLAARQES